MSGEGAAVSQRTVRRLYGQRQEAADPSDRWFAVYVVLLMLSIYALPTALVVGDSLDGTSAAALTSDGAATAVSAGFSLLALLVLLLGTLQGPAYLTPFLAQTLLAGAFDRRRVLLRPVLSAWLLCVLAGTAAAATAGIAMVRTPEWGSAELARFLGAGAAAGLHLGLLWLIGQRWGRRAGAAIAILPLLPAVWAILPLLSPRALWLTPGGWLGLVWAGQGSPAAWAVSAAVGVVGAVVLLAVPGVLQRMPAQAVIEQSQQIAAARLFSSTGNFAEVGELYRARPRRRHSALMRSALRHPPSGLRGAAAAAVQDAAATLRTPARLAVGTIVMSLGAALAALAFGSARTEGADQAEPLVIVPAVLLGAALMHLGSGTFADGWRRLKAEFDAAPLFGWSVGGSLLRRLPWPVGMTALGWCFGASAAALWGGQAWSPAMGGAGWSAVLSMVVLAARFMQTMRDAQMPVESLVPIPTPFGDLSGLRVLIWVADGLLLSLTAALGMLLLPWVWWTVLLAAVACAATSVVIGWSRTGQAWSTGAPRSRCRNTGLTLSSR